MYFDLGTPAPAFTGAVPPAKSIVPRERLWLQVSMTTWQIPQQGLATYYRNLDFTGETFSRIETNIDLNWSDCTHRRSRTTLSVRWSGQADFPSPHLLPLRRRGGFG
jgi:hypothetical protein